MQQFNQVIVTMRIQIGDNKHAKTTEFKTFYPYLPKNVDNNVKHEIDLVCQLVGVSPTYERYILGPILVNRHVSSFQKTMLAIFIFLLCVYFTDSLQIRIFLKYIGQAYMVIIFLKTKVK